MSYSIIQPPFTLDFPQMSKADLRRYFEWFMRSIPVRIAQLEMAVIETKGFETWKADFSPASLEPLGNWFAMQVGARHRTQEEIEKIKSQLPIPIEVSREDLNTRTLSLAMDIGMYLSKVFQTNYSHVTWEQPLRSKRFVDYGQPVLVGFGGAPLNPVSIVIVLAYGICRGTKSGADLRKIYDYWANLAAKRKRGEGKGQNKRGQS